jgi:SAM-dependent methyltransferase
MRNSTDFDNWYLRSPGGDPWGLDGNPYEATRLQLSLHFIQRRIGRRFSGRFIETGCFHGAFTALLARAYPSSAVVANDISKVALDEARKRLGALDLTNISFLRSDLADIQDPADARQNVLLLLESLYYTPESQWMAVLRRLIEALRPSHIFVSGPITGEPYFIEQELIALFAELSYQFAAARPLTWRGGFRGSFNWLKRINLGSAFRRKHADQVIYYFSTARRRIPQRPISSR